MVQRFKYVGAQSPVDIPSLGLVEVTTGTHVEVQDPEQARGMHGSDSWEHIPDPKRSKAAKKAAESRADDDDSQEG